MSHDNFKTTTEHTTHMLHVKSCLRFFPRAELQLQLQYAMLKLKLKLKIDSRKKSEITLHMQCVFCVPGGGLKIIM